MHHHDLGHPLLSRLKGLGLALGGQLFFLAAGVGELSLHFGNGGFTLLALGGFAACSLLGSFRLGG